MDQTPNELIETPSGELRRHESEETATIRRRYDRVAPFYDTLEWFMERHSLSKWRPDLWARVEGDCVLEVGVGTGKSLHDYPRDRDVMAVDISPKMLERARRRADKLGVDVTLIEADVQALPFEDCSFDSVVTTCVFCSVPDPVKGLREIHRVLKPGGRVLMLEHVLSHKPVFHRLMRWFDFLPYRIWGAHINRETVDNVRRAGFDSVEETNLSLDIVKRIEAIKTTKEVK